MIKPTEPEHDFRIPFTMKPQAGTVSPSELECRQPLCHSNLMSTKPRRRFCVCNMILQNNAFKIIEFQNITGKLEKKEVESRC